MPANDHYRIAGRARWAIPHSDGRAWITDAVCRGKARYTYLRRLLPRRLRAPVGHGNSIHDLWSPSKAVQAHTLYDFDAVGGRTTASILRETPSRLDLCRRRDRLLRRGGCGPQC